MIVSFHPCFEGNQNRLCAGRAPDTEDHVAVVGATAVILPQGCRQDLYQLARTHCPHVFPNYDSRFQHPDKIGQIALFQKIKAAHPTSCSFADVTDYRTRHGDDLPANLAFPVVFKFNWGGEGEQVFLLQDLDQMVQMLAQARCYESTGQFGFLLQEYVPAQGRCLRVVVIAATLISYWRVHAQGAWCANLAGNGRIDHQYRPDLQAAGRDRVQQLCHRSGINLAGIDLLFDMRLSHPTPLLLEINYFFGRRGLGGSARYYRLLCDAIEQWLADRRIRRYA